jgi:hypothetical protein
VHVHVLRLVSVVKMGTVLEGCSTEGQHSVVCFLWARGLNANNVTVIKKRFLLMVGSVYHVKRFRTGSRNLLKDI